jgi:predicted GIY-YIG superfamily endonuclease
MGERIIGTVYLLHFDRPYRHALHYVGWTRNLEQRIKQHRAGRFSVLMRAVRDAGIGFRVARLWIGVPRRFERRLHQMKKKPLCPMCTLRVAGTAKPRLSDFEPLEYPWHEHPRGPDVLVEPDPEFHFQYRFFTPGLEPNAEENQPEAERGAPEVVGESGAE